MEEVIEIRSYQLKVDQSAQFHHLVSTQSVPLQASAGIKVLHYGFSLSSGAGSDQDYVLIRQFANLTDLIQCQSDFYQSAAWLSGPRESILACIQSSHSIVIPAIHFPMKAHHE
ncbi:NIPSNAP family protein [Undibacterium sp. Dicai25W]|uniref:NIPSNAP family protein n=1 Tax=Undibacterium sp. Dicai25W TaxID=3413034 RepID=UPI003BF203AC